MNLTQFVAAASEALVLIGEYPARWLGVTLLFLIAVEALMFIPYVGFVLKLAVAGVVSAQFVALFGAAAAGQPPSPLGLLGAFSLPAGSQAVLVAAALLPFAVAVLFLYWKVGPSVLQFFFGNIVKAESPPADAFAQSKYLMYLVALPFTLLAGAVVIKGLSGVAAVSAAVAAVVVNWLPVLLITLLAFAFEWLSVQLPSLLPKPVAVATSITLLVIYLVWSVAITYTVSARAFAGVANANAA